MAELKTKATAASVARFVAGIKDDRRRREVETVLALMKSATREDPRMWGTSIVGFGDQRYRYASGREGNWFLVGFSPRKQNLTLYLSGGFADAGPLLAELGKHTTGKGCLYLRSLEDVHLPTLERLIARVVESGVRAHEAVIGATNPPSGRNRSAGTPSAKGKTKAGAKAKTSARSPRG